MKYDILTDMVNKARSKNTTLSDVLTDEALSRAEPVVESSIFSESEDDIWPDDKSKNFDVFIKKGEVLRKEWNEEMKVSLPITLTFAELMSKEYPKARYALDPFFEAETLNMVSAPPNTFKSWLLFYFSSCIAGGTNAFDKFPTEKCAVMIVNEEDSHRAVQDRFNILSIQDKTLPIYFRIASGAKLTKKFIEEIIKECEEKNIKVVMFDSLRSMHEAEENDSTAMQHIMDMLKYLSRAGLTVVFTHHHRKKSMFSKGDDAEASRGSSAINAAVSGHISLEEEERADGKYLILRHLKSKAGAKLDPCEIKIVNKDGKVSFVYNGEFKSGEGKLIQAKNAIMFSLKSGETKTVNDFILLEVAGKNVVRAALNALVLEGSLGCCTRSEAPSKGLEPGEGKKNEKLYYLPTDEEIRQEEMFNSI